MTVDNLIKKLRVMLGAQTEEVVASTKEVSAYAEAELVDGTKVQVEGELEVGKVLSVITEEGLSPAPAGLHATTEGLLITVGENGVIETIEEEAPAEPVVEETTEETVEAEVFQSEHLLSSIAELIQPFTTQINELKAELGTLSQRFQTFSDEPAAEPIKRTFKQNDEEAKTIAEARFAKLVQMRNKK